MNASYQFAPIRIYSGAKSNKKCKAITEFIKELFDRSFYDRTYTNRDAIVEAVKKECRIIDSKGTAKGQLSVSTNNTGEYGDQRDWRMTVSYVKEGSFPISVCDILCFYSMGGILDKAVEYASQTVGEIVRKKYGM